MKQLFITLFFLSFIISTYASENDTIPKTTFDHNNEVCIDVTRLIAEGRMGISYERFISKHLSGGLNVVFLNSKNITEDDYYYYRYDYINNLQVNPYVRFFFYQRKKKVFFAETFFTYHNGTYVDIQRLNDGQYAYYAYQNNPASGWGGGVAIGGKYYIKNQIVIELLLGLGSSQMKNNQTYTFSHSGINVGYRF